MYMYIYWRVHPISFLWVAIGSRCTCAWLDWTWTVYTEWKEERKKKLAYIHVHVCTHTHTYTLVMHSFIHSIQRTYWPPIPTLKKRCRDPPLLLFAYCIVLYCIYMYIHMDVPSSTIASLSYMYKFEEGPSCSEWATREVPAQHHFKRRYSVFYIPIIDIWLNVTPPPPTIIMIMRFFSFILFLVVPTSTNHSTIFSFIRKSSHWYSLPLYPTEPTITRKRKK